MTSDGVHESGETGAIHEVRPELGPLGHGPRNDGGRGGCEHVLEKPRASILVGPANQEKVGVADEGVASLPVREGEPQAPVGNCPNARIQDVFHEDVGRVFRPHCT